MVFKKLSVASVSAFIEGLLFTLETYQRRKSILQTKYDKTSETLTSLAQHIMQLPVIFAKNLVRVRVFHEKLVTRIQALEAIGKLQETNDIIYLLIDKIPGLTAELVINDDNWQE